MTKKDGFALFRKHLREFPKQLSRPLAVEGKNRRPAKLSAVFVCGMGGSGIAGDIVRALAPEAQPEIRTWKNYGLPPKKDAGYIFVSFSGNTEETLSGLKEALRKHRSRILGVVASGGALRKIAEKKNLRRVIIHAPDLTPREAVGYNVNAVLLLLHSSFPRIGAPRVSLNSSSLEETGKKIARATKGKIPLIYTEEGGKAVGYAWKMHINETGKTPCFTNVIPEMNHNEIQSFENNRLPFFAIFLTGKRPSPQIAKRIRVCASILKHRKIGSMVVPLRGKTDGERLWNGILLGAWTGFSLAKLKNTDPMATPAIATLKKLIAR